MMNVRYYYKQSEDNLFGLILKRKSGFLETGLSETEYYELLFFIPGAIYECECAGSRNEVADDFIVA